MDNFLTGSLDLLHTIQISGLLLFVEVMGDEAALAPSGNVRWLVVVAINCAYARAARELGGCKKSPEPSVGDRGRTSRSTV